MFPVRHLALVALLALGEAFGFVAGDVCVAWPIAAFFTLVFALGGFGLGLRHWSCLAVLFLGFALALHSENGRRSVLLVTERTGEPLSAELIVQDVHTTPKGVSFDSTLDGVALRVMMPKDAACRPRLQNDAFPVDAACRPCLQNDAFPVDAACRPRLQNDAFPVDAVCRPRLQNDAFHVDAVYRPRLPEIGETWRITGWLEKKDLSDRRRRRVWIAGRTAVCERVAPAPALSLRKTLARVRARLSRAAGYGLAHNPIDADLDRAILLGERSNIPKEERQAFVDAGTVHVFAISGMHVMVIAWLLVYFLMAVFWVPLRWVGLAVMPILAAYVVMIGSPPSAVRAAAMAGVYFAAPIFWRRSDALVAWAITFLVFHLVNPQYLYDVGSLLSFTVMLGILLFIRWAAAFRSRALTYVGVPLAAWVSGVGIVAHVFGVVTPGGLLANFAILPIASLAVVLGFLGAIVSCVFPWLGAHFNNAAALLVEAMRGISWGVAQLPYAQIEVENWPLWESFAWYAVWGLALWLVRSVWLRRRSRL